MKRRQFIALAGAALLDFAAFARVSSFSLAITRRLRLPGVC
jgi:hypothetical protein